MEVPEYYLSYPYPNIKFKSKKDVLKGPFAWRMRKIFQVLKINPSDLKGKKVLDIGCGTGEKPIYYALQGAEVDAIDQSKESIKVAKQKAEKLGVNVNFICSSLFDFKYKKYDFVFCLGVLHHTKNPKKGFDLISNAVKKNGFIEIGLYHKYGRLPTTFNRFILSILPLNLNQKIKLLKKVYKDRWLNDRVIYDRFLVPHESTHTIKETKKWFKENNFSFIDSHPKPKSFGEFGFFPKKGFFLIGGKKL
ncbi:class I SAM-dependent methyltransferase [Candidatus Micrarchaeota archaeon]|nr:class I SAM-dependent methyltransferase [Candidatus Micrarchaeota archaeon]